MDTTEGSYDFDATELPLDERLDDTNTNLKVDDLIMKHALAAMAIGLVPMPLVDMAALAALQLNMARTISNANDSSFLSDKAATKIIGSVMGAIAPVLVAPAAFSLLKFVPVVGHTIAGVTMPVLLGASTYVVGQVLAGTISEGTYRRPSRTELKRMMGEARIKLQEHSERSRESASEKNQSGKSAQASKAG